MDEVRKSGGYLPTTSSCFQPQAAPANYSLSDLVRHCGVISLVSNFDGVEFINVVIKVSTNSLYIGSYSKTQQWLFERVRSLREDQKLTFAAIAEKLTKFGLKSARGAQLAAEHVFSIYKKGTRRQARLIAEAHTELVDVSPLGRRAVR